MTHDWALKVGLELNGGSSLPTRIHCRRCRLGFWASQINEVHGRLGDICPGESVSLLDPVQPPLPTGALVGTLPLLDTDPARGNTAIVADALAIADVYPAGYDGAGDDVMQVLAMEVRRLLEVERLWRGGVNTMAREIAFGSLGSQVVLETGAPTMDEIRAAMKYECSTSDSDRTGEALDVLKRMVRCDEALLTLLVPGFGGMLEDDK